MRRLSVTAFALTLGLCLSACAEDPIEPPPLVAGGSSSGSPIQQPSPKTDPERRTPLETVRAYFDAKNDLESDGDATKFLALATTDCESCRSYATTLKEAYAAGGKYTSRPWKILSITKRPGAKSVGTSREFTVQVDAPPARFIPEAGAEVQHFPGGRSSWWVVVDLDQGNWLVSVAVKDA